MDKQTNRMHKHFSTLLQKVKKESALLLLRKFTLSFNFFVNLVSKETYTHYK